MAEFGGGFCLQLTANDTQKYKDVLEPEKDLIKNFEIDLNGTLQKLTEELAVNKAKHDISEINFTLAGFVVQGSANVYGKKVDLLHSLTYQMLDNMSTNYKVLNNGDADDRQSSRVKNFEFKEIKLVDMNHETTVPLHQLSLSKRQLQITSIPDCLKNLETCQKVGDNMLSKTGEDIGHPKDYSINRFTHDCINIRLSHQVSGTSTIGQDDSVPKNCLEYSDSDDDDHTPEPFVPNYNGTVNESDESLGGLIDHHTPLLRNQRSQSVARNGCSERTNSRNGNEPKNNINLTNSAYEDVYQNGNVSPDPNSIETDVNGSEETSEGMNNYDSSLANSRIIQGDVCVLEMSVKTKHSRTTMKCKSPMPLDSNEVKVKDEKRPGLRKRILVNPYTKACEGTARTPKKRKSVDEAKYQTEPKVKEEPICDYFERTAHPENYSKPFLKNLPYYPLKPFAYQEFERREEMDKLKMQNVQMEEAQLDANGECTGLMVLGNGNIEAEELRKDLSGYCNGDNRVNQENSENGYDSCQDDNLALDNEASDPDSQSQKGAFDLISSTYKKMALNLENMKCQSSQFHMSTDLSKRVESWNLHMNVILQEERKHVEFDANLYQADILNCFDNEGQTINFQKVVRGKQAYDVGRFLVCSLFLANNLNVEIHQDDVSNDIQLKLLSGEIRGDIIEGIF